MATYSKPADLARAIKGVLFGTINHLVDTFNWLVSCWDNVKAGSGIKLEGVEKGSPKISANIVEGDYIRVEDYPDGALRISVDEESLPKGINVYGGDSGSYMGATSLFIESESDSNVKISITQLEGGETGQCKIKVGLYYA